MIGLKGTRIGKLFLYSGIWFVLVFLLAYTRANAQTNDLIDAAGNGDLPQVKSLLDNGADVNAKLSDGQTALTNAAGKDHLDVVLVLLDRGADVNAKTDKGETALILAEQLKDPELFQALLGKGADVNAKTNTGDTALILAERQKDPQLVRMLLDKGADVNAKTNTGETALILAVNLGDFTLVQALLDKGADVNAKTNDGVIALDAARQGGNYQIRRVLERVACLAAQAEFRRTPQIGILQEGTPVKLRVSRTISSQSARTGQEVRFSVVENVIVSGIPVIKVGDQAIGTVIKAQHGKSMGRGGKLDLSIRFVRLANQEQVPLREEKEFKGKGKGGHMAKVTVIMTATGILAPFAPLALTMHGENTTISGSSEITAYVNEERRLDLTKFKVLPPCPR
jgi:hypothetical protein